MNETDKNTKRRYEDIKSDRRKKSQAEPAPNELVESLENTFETSVNEGDPGQLKAGL